MERYVDAFCHADVDRLVELLREDVVLEMPPVPLWFAGHHHYAQFMHRVYTMRPGTWRAIPVSANWQPAFAAYAPANDQRWRAHSLQVLDTIDGQVVRNVVFANPALFSAFGLPAGLGDD